MQVTTGRQKGLLLAAEDCRRVPMCNVNPGFELWQYQFEVVPDLNRKTKINWCKIDNFKIPVSTECSRLTIGTAVY